MKDAGVAARRFSVVPAERTLEKFRMKFRQVLLSLDGHSELPLLICSEEFAGMIPGRKGVWSYGQTHILAEVIWEEINRLTDNKARITFFYTTRDTADWIKSVYWQNIRGNRIQEDLWEYTELLDPGADLDGVVARVADQMSSRADVISLNTSGLSDRLFPVTKVLSILNVRSDEDVMVAKQAYLKRFKAST